jgi:hypothetical protein
MLATSTLRFLRPSGGRSKRLCTSAVQAVSACRLIRSVWGYGSSFLRGNFADIDLLVVIERRERSLVEDTVEAKRILMKKLPNWLVPFHILVVTEQEFRENPLRDMHSLKPLALRHSCFFYHPKGDVLNTPLPLRERATQRS